MADTASAVMQRLRISTLLSPISPASEMGCWGAEQAGGGQGRAVAREAGDAVHAPGLNGFGQGHGRPEGGEAPRQHGFARPRGPRRRKIWSARLPIVLLWDCRAKLSGLCGPDLTAGAGGGGRHAFSRRVGPSPLLAVLQPRRASADRLTLRAMPATAVSGCSPS
jgi:hypothetical protein